MKRKGFRSIKRQIHAKGRRMAGEGQVLLVGVLAAPEVAPALGLRGEAAAVPGRLAGGGRAGIARDGWPRLVAGEGSVPALRVEGGETLARYAAVFGIAPVPTPAGRVLGIAAVEDESSRIGQPDSPDPADPRLVAAIARMILASPDLPTATLARRLPQIAVAAASGLRAEAMDRPRTCLPQPGEDRVAVIARDQHHAGYFSVETVTLRHSLHAGGLTPPFTREVFTAGDAVLVLPWDRARDRVLVIDQFRAAMAVRGEPLPWMIEAIAGRIDAGETAEQAAIREAQEEAAITLDRARMIAGPHHYPSPGVLNEYLYTFVALCDLPDGIAGIAGLESETEDIRAHLLPRSALTDLALRGQLPNGPLALLVLWLAVAAPDLTQA